MNLKKILKTAGRIVINPIFYTGAMVTTLCFLVEGDGAFDCKDHSLYHFNGTLNGEHVKFKEEINDNLLTVHKEQIGEYGPTGKLIRKKYLDKKGEDLNIESITTQVVRGIYDSYPKAQEHYTQKDTLALEKAQKEFDSYLERILQEKLKQAKK